MYFYINRFIIIILFNAVISGYSSNENSVFINITKQETNKLKVTYRYKKNIPNRNIFYFPRTVIGAYSDIPYTEYISDFAVYYNNGTSKSFSISKNKVDLSGIEYID